jgi:hypothetical protein
LQTGKYFGIEPNTWLVEDAIENQLGRDLISIKQPSFSDSADFTADVFDASFDHILTQSIFSHSGPTLKAEALSSFARRLAPDGLCAVIFMHGDKDTPEGWFYSGLTPQGPVQYRPSLIKELVGSAGLKGAPIPWFSPGQTWWLSPAFPSDGALHPLLQSPRYWSSRQTLCPESPCESDVSGTNWRCASVPALKRGLQQQEIRR